MVLQACLASLESKVLFTCSDGIQMLELSMANPGSRDLLLYAGVRLLLPHTTNMRPVTLHIR